MTLQTFKNDIKNNNITDFTPYLDVKYTENYRAEMIKNNILVEESVARKEQLPLIAAIRKGYAKAHYKDWAHHQSAAVRKALATEGYFPTHFLSDKFFANNPLWSKDISIERKLRIDQLTKEYGRDVIGQNIEKLLNVNTYYNTIDELRTKYSS